MRERKNTVNLRVTKASSPQEADRFLKTNGARTRVLFIQASWCGHCQQMKPIVNRALKNADPEKLAVMTIDGDKHGEEIDKMLPDGLKAFPTFVRCSSDGGCIVKTGAMSEKAFKTFAKL